MNERKHGTVRGFRGCSEEYLASVCEDLQLGIGPSLMRTLQQAYADEQRDPTVDALCLDAAYMKQSCLCADSVLVTELTADDEALKELFARTVRDCGSAASRRETGLSPALAAEEVIRRYAEPADVSLAVCPADVQEFPPFPGPYAVRSAGGYTVRISERRNRPYSPVCTQGILIGPGEDTDPETFIAAAGVFASEVMDAFPAVSLHPCTDAGLLCDLMRISDSFELVLPGYPEDAVRSRAPGFILFCTPEEGEQIAGGAGKAGFSAEIVYSAAQSGITLYSSASPVTADAAHFRRLALFRKVSAPADGSPLYGLGPLFVTSAEDDDCEAFSLRGAPYEALEALYSPHCRYCIAGTLNPSDPVCAPFLTALRSFLRNYRPAVGGVRFRHGETTSVTVFRFGANGRNLPLCQPRRRVTPLRDEPRPVVSSLAELCGNTPLLRLYPGLPARVLAKLEMFNPAGSAKDRVALRILREARESGLLADKGTVIEATSGNTGIGLAAYGCAMGYRVIIVMPDTMSAERIALIRAYGAEIVLTDGSLGMSGSTAEAERIRASIPGSVIASQFDNPANPRAHELTTGPEIWRDTCGKTDILVAGIGTGGTLCGTAAFLKKMNPSLIVIGAEPASSPLLTQGYAGAHKIQGIGANFVPANYNPALVDRVIAVSDEDAIAETVRIARTTGLLCGISSGCAAFAARTVAADPRNLGKTVVTILPDTGEHYLSTGIFG